MAFPSQDDVKEPSATTDFERRRPGRSVYANPELLDLMRGDFEGEIDQDQDDLEAAIGLISSILVSLAMWGAIAAIMIFG